MKRMVWAAACAGLGLASCASTGSGAPAASSLKGEAFLQCIDDVYVLSEGVWRGDFVTWDEYQGAGAFSDMTDQVTREDGVTEYIAVFPGGARGPVWGREVRDGAAIEFSILEPSGEVVETLNMTITQCGPAGDDGYYRLVVETTESVGPEGSETMMRTQSTQVFGPASAYIFDIGQELEGDGPGKLTAVVLTRAGGSTFEP